MLTHIVIFSWKPDVTEAQVQHLAGELDSLCEDVSDFGDLIHGPDLHIRDGNGDYALIATFRERAGWDAYQAHPKHKAFVRDVVTALQESRLTIQFAPGGVVEP